MLQVCFSLTLSCLLYALGGNSGGLTSLLLLGPRYVFDIALGTFAAIFALAVPFPRPATVDLTYRYVCYVGGQGDFFISNVCVHPTRS